MRSVVIATVLLSAPLAAQTATTTVQQDYNAATALTDAGKDAEALAAWEALERRTAKNPRSHAIAQVRKAMPLMRLNRLDEAATATRAALAALPASDESLKADRASAHLTLALIDKIALDYASALVNYRAALTLAPTPTDELTSLLGAIRVGTFVDPEATLPLAARAEEMLRSKNVSDDAKGVVGSALSELYLNLGRFDDARKAAGEAVRKLGGLTTRTNIADVVARSDYALAALKLKREDEARMYLAYTGAGRSVKGSFDPSGAMKSPACGGEDGLKPDDVAIVEFTVGDDGRVSNPVPVYASRPGKIALSFARAARDWSWSTDSLKDLPVFFRTRVRVELRCSNEFARPAASDLLFDAFYDWLAAKRTSLFEREGGFGSARLASDRTALAAAEARDGKDALSHLGLLMSIATNPVTPNDDVNAAATRALAIVTRERAPPAARLAVELRILLTGFAPQAYERRYPAALATALVSTLYAADPVARGVLALLLSDFVRGKDPVRAKSLLATVAGDAALPVNHPLKVGALIRIASIEQGEGNHAAAVAAFEKSGLGAAQCAMLDASPTLIASGASSSDFPMEAIRWGFGGWTVTQFDVAAEGRATNVRTVVAYPPFVFGAAATGILKDARFTKTFRPDGGLGCGSLTRRVVFRMPG